MYGSCELIDGPHQGTYIPFHGMPRYGVAIEVTRHVDGSWLRLPKDVVDIYKVVKEDYDHAEARFIGTVCEGNGYGS